MGEEFEALYRYLRLVHYKKLFEIISERPGSLSATEAFSAEVIYLLGEPTIGEFARFLGISQPNASYKVISLVSKGYISKNPCENDKRECRLAVTQKFRDYYGSQLPDISVITQTLTSTESSALKKLSGKIVELLSQTLEA